MILEISSLLDAAGSRRVERRAVASTQKRGYGVFDAGPALIRYRSHGRGPSLVFATDPPVVLEQYDELVAELSTDHSVTILELPGFGFSSARPGYDFSLASTVAVVERFLSSLDQGPSILVFPCATAYSAVSVAAARPELVSALVLVQAPSWPEELSWKARRDPKGILCTPIIGQLALRMNRRQRAPEWFDAAAASRARRDEFVASTDAAFREGAGFALASAFQRYLTGAPHLPPARVPALVVWGLADRTHRKTDRTSSRLLAPEALFVEAPSLGHFPELEDPAWFARTLRDFSSGHRAAE